jgi:transposase-like protein
MPRPRRIFKPEFKFQVVMEYLTGHKGRTETLREHEISDSTLERWCKILQERGPEVFAAGRAVSAEQRRIAELERIIGRLTIELEASKKVSNWLKSRS